jgi:hypothetical protein
MIRKRDRYRLRLLHRETCQYYFHAVYLGLAARLPSEFPRTLNVLFSYDFPLDPKKRGKGRKRDTPASSSIGQEYEFPDLCMHMIVSSREDIIHKLCLRAI